MSEHNLDIVKVCLRHGNLTIDQVNKHKNRKYLDCKQCRKDNARRRREKNPEKYKAQRLAYTIIDRDPNTELMRCCICKTEKKVFEFNPSMLKIRTPYCRECSIASLKKSQSKPENKERHKNWYNRHYRPMARNLHYIKHYGITLEDYDKILCEQGGLCAICKKPQKKSARNHDNYLAVDHCHETKKVRGLLCNKCNQGIGLFDEKISLMKEALKYMEKHHAGNDPFIVPLS